MSPFIKTPPPLPESPCSFGVGDVVVLKSQTTRERIGKEVLTICQQPRMTVDSVYRNKDWGRWDVSCMWFDTVGVLHRDSFSSEVLVGVNRG